MLVAGELCLYGVRVDEEAALAIRTEASGMVRLARGLLVLVDDGVFLDQLILSVRKLTLVPVAAAALVQPVPAHFGFIKTLLLIVEATSEGGLGLDANLVRQVLDRVVQIVKILRNLLILEAVLPIFGALVVKRVEGGRSSRFLLQLLLLFGHVSLLFR